MVQSLGMFGVVWATAIEMAIVYLIVLPNIIARVTGISWIKLYRDAFVLPIVKTAAILAPFYFLAHGYLEPKYGKLVLLGSSQVIYFLPLAFFLITSSRERKMILDTIRGDRKRTEGVSN